jgi:ATP-binding cassette, subfamily C, bacteriocin exporter
MISEQIKKIKSSFIKTDKKVPAAVGCLASIFRYFGHNLLINEVHDDILAGNSGLSLYGIMEAARAKGFVAEGYEGDLNFLKEFYKPIILPVEKKTGYDHCFTLYGWLNSKFIIGDPHWSIIEYRQDELEALWVSKSFLLIRPGDQ